MKIDEIVAEKTLFFNIKLQPHFLYGLQAKFSAKRRFSSKYTFKMRDYKSKFISIMTMAILWLDNSALCFVL